MRTRHYLRRRILAGFALFGLTVVGFSIGTFVKAYYDGQDSLTEALINAEVARIQARFAMAGTAALPRQEPLYAYTRIDDMTPLHAELAAGLAPGLHEMDTGTGPAVERDMAILVVELEGTSAPLWVVFDMPDVETIPRIARDYSELAVAYGAALLLFGGWLATTISRRISDPLERFAAEIEAQPPGQWRGDFAARYDVGEVGAMATALDTTIRRNRDLLERERVFMQNASHELRTPITVVRGAAEVLETLPELRGSRAQQIVQRIARASRDMTALTEAFLWLGREPDSNGDRAECDAEQVVKNALRQTLHLLQDKPVEVGIESAGSVTIGCRPELLEIALVNLLRNAFQHTESGRVDVVISNTAIEVLDTGPGIAVEDADRLKRRGRRGRDSDGFGLGLAIVDQLCERLGWRLEIDNRHSGGCRARIANLSA